MGSDLKVIGSLVELVKAAEREPGRGTIALPFTFNLTYMFDTEGPT